MFVKDKTTAKFDEVLMATVGHGWCKLNNRKEEYHGGHVNLWLKAVHHLVTVNHFFKSEFLSW